jgi:membrane protease YdiL (CAAX protease family)
MFMSSNVSNIRSAKLIIWSLLPCVAMWLGLYQLKSALWAYALYHCLCLVPAIVLNRSLWLSTFKKPSIRDCALLLIAAIAFSALALLAYEIFGPKVLSNEHVPLLLKEQGISRNLYIFFALYSTIVNPLLEELYWRGIVFNALDKPNIRPKYFAITCSSLLYALFHYLIFRLVLYPGWAELGTLLLAGYGAILALIYRKTGSIITTAMAHGLLTDLACVVLLIDYFRKYGMP